MTTGTDQYQNTEGEPGIPGRDNWRDSLRNLRTFSSFKNPIYRLYYGGMVGQWAAMNMQMFARVWLVYRLTGSAAILGGMAVANALPMLFLSLFGGVIADRVQKKYVLLIGQACSALVALGIALSLTLGYISTEEGGSWWILIVASVLQGAIMGLMMPSRQAIIREIVGEEHLLNAMSLNNLGMNGLRLFAPAATGFLIGTFSYQTVYYAMTGMYLMSIGFIVFLPLTSTTTIGSQSVLSSMKEGFRYLWHETTILIIVSFLLLAIVFSQPYAMLMPVFAVDILHVGEAEAGWLMSVAGIGAIAGSLVLASLPNKKRGLILLASSLLVSLALVAFSLSSTWSLSLVIIIFVGLGQTGQMTLAGTLIQYYVDPEYLGRVMSILMMQFGFMSVGTFAAGLLAESVGAQWAIGGFASVLVLISILAMIFIPRIRNLD